MAPQRSKVNHKFVKVMTDCVTNKTENKNDVYQ